MKLFIVFILFLLIACQPKENKYLNENEAYVGAPPTMKHEIDGYESCKDCHTDDGDEDATQTSHAERINCIQCHVPANTDIKPEYENTFKSGFKHLNMKTKKKNEEE